LISDSTELPVRRVLLFGFGALYLLLAIALRPMWFAVGTCTLFLAAIGLGFTFLPKDNFTAYWIAGQEEESLMLQGHEVAARYPQAVVFRTELKNIWLLCFAVAVGVVALNWLMHHPLRELDPKMVYVFRFVGVPAAYLGYKWVRERWILRHQTAVLGAISGKFGDFISYEYFYDNGERHGG
jgi:hypothetical protein